MLMFMFSTGIVFVGKVVFDYDFCSGVRICLDLLMFSSSTIADI